MRKVLASHIEEGLPIHLAVNSIHLLNVNSLFFCVLPSGCLEINDKTGILSKKALSLGDNIFDAVLFVFQACEEILRCHSPAKQPLANLLGASTEMVFCHIAVQTTRGRRRLRATYVSHPASQT